MARTTFTVKTVSQLAGVSVRTLQHYYDAVHLLQPAQQTEAGYRLCARKNLC